MTSLVEIGQALSSAANLKAALRAVLHILENQQEIAPSAIVLLSERSGSLVVEAANGLAAAELRQLPHDDLIRRVAESGQPVVVSESARGPVSIARPAHRTRPINHDQVFICVPIISNRRPAGALGAVCRLRQGQQLDDAFEFLRVVAALVAQSVKVNRLLGAATERLLDENVNLRAELGERYDFANIIGNSGPMRQVYEQVAQVACTGTTVLICGESGTGKELIADAIHRNSPRAGGPLIKVNCAALPETLIEAELFGYEKGAFTGASASKKGRFELADGGTLFLDEVGDLSPAAQVKLLRVLQEREFDRLGGGSTVRVNVRLIAATNRDLEKAVAAETFRQDLYYRLNVFTITIPPLRARKDDVALLADHFLKKYAVEHGKNVRRISTLALDLLTSYHWPGNVRELENAIERAVLVCDGNVVHSYHLPPALQIVEDAGAARSRSLVEAVEAFEKEIIQDALKTTRGNRTRAALLLKTTERVISYKVKKYGIDCARLKT
jgi:Nif-specific regulatory protein